MTAKKRTDSSRTNPLMRQYSAKLRAYGKEDNVHPIVMGTDGDIHGESWRFLSELGFNIANLRDMQHIIMRYSSYKIQDAMSLNVRAWKQRDRNSRRRRNRLKSKKNAAAEKKPEEGSILGYLE